MTRESRPGQPALYDTIGVGYRELRRPDPRLAAVVRAGLGDARSVLNVGAGAGSYEPGAEAHDVLAVELSAEMIAQRGPESAPVVQASATALPIATDSFDACLAILTVHHWPDRGRGLEELRRVARGPVVLLTWDPAALGFWLTDYFPDILDIDRRIFPDAAELERHLGRLDQRPVPIPADCTDGFLGAYWRRPEAYLRDAVRAVISTFHKLDDPAPGLARLASDLATGAWHERYGDVLERTELDLGYRLVVAPGTEL